MHVLVVLSHPEPKSFSRAVADAYCEGVEAAGHTWELADLYREGFDPVMSERDMQQFQGVPMPRDVQAEQARVERSEAICLVFPTWWYGMPAMMKGWLDRVWSAGWAYAWQHDPENSLLKPRPMTFLMPTGASQRLLERYGIEDRFDHIQRYGVLGYCGVDPIRIHMLLDASSETPRELGIHETHLKTAYQSGRQVFSGDAYHVDNAGGRE